MKALISPLRCPTLFLRMCWVCSLLGCCAALFSQTPCATDALHALRMSEDSTYRAAHTGMEGYIWQRAKTSTPAHAPDFSSNPMPLVLPVVLHIVHQNGPENLSDAQAETIITHLNAAFAHGGYFAQQGPGADVLIQFCLARQNPAGAPSTGITRTASPLTDVVLETQDLQLKDLARWNPFRYINIWVVRNVISLSAGNGVAGYAYLPAAHGLDYDGIVVEASGLGISPAGVSSLAHEMGHYLGLYHTFEGGCANANCLTDGDRVCDTPPDRAIGTACAFNSCATDADDASANNPFTTDVDDAGWNLLDYSPQPCYSGFSAGQGLRMRTAAEGSRKSLLLSKGCQEPCPASALAAAFALADSSVLVGTALVFTNLSAGATQFAWYDGNVLISNAATPPPYTPLTTGIHTLRLVVNNGDPHCADSAKVLVSVACNITAGIAASDTTLDIGQSVTLTALSSGADQWAWTTGGASLSADSSFSYLFSQNGTISVELVATNAYCSVTTSLLLTMGGLCPQYFFREHARSTPNAAGVSPLRPQAMETTRDGGYIVTGYVLSQGACITKFSAGGWQEWQRVLVGTSFISQIVHTSDGSYVLSGFADASQTIGFIMKCDAAGEVLWAKRFLSVKSGRVLITICTAGGYYGLVQRIASAISSTWVAFRMDADGNMLWSVSYTTNDGVADIQPTADGSLMIGRGQARLIKLSKNGQLVFAKRYGTGATYFLKQENKAILTDENDTYLISGWGNGYLWKVDEQGQVLWGRYSANHLKMTVLPGEGLLVHKDAEVQKLSAATGQMLWARSTGGPFGSANGEQGLYTLQGPRSGRAVYSFREAGVWNALNMYEFSTLDGKRAGCVGDLPGIGDGHSVNIGSQDDTLTLGNLPPNWEPLVITSIPGTYQFITTRFCKEELCQEICDNGRDDDGNAYVDCYDPACPCAKPDLACHDTTLVADIKGHMAWTTPTDEVSVVAVPLAGNLNPLSDSLPEIIVPTAPASIGSYATRLLVFRGDGSNAQAPDELIVPGGYLSYPMAHPTIADLDGDGRVELTIMNAEGFVYIFTDYQPGTNPCMKLWLKNEVASTFTGLRIYPADFNHDGISELYSGFNVYWLDFSNPGKPALQSNQVFSTNLYGAFVANSTTYPVNSSLAADVCADNFDCEICPKMEIVAGDAAVSVISNSTGGFDLEFAPILCSDVITGIGYAAIAQVTSVPSLIPILTTSISGTVQLCDKDITWAAVLGDDSNFSQALICIANVLDDRQLGLGYQKDLPEILIGRGGYLYCLNTQAANALWWKIPTGINPLTGRAVSAFDFNGDGYEEIVLHDSTHIRVLYGGPPPFPPGVDAERNWFKIKAPSLPLDNYPVIADVDGDLEAEIIYTAYADEEKLKNPQDLRGRLVVLKSDGEAWYPARPVWNQFSYLPVAIHDDLTVPQQQQPHHVPLPPGADQRPLNKHMAQLPLMDSLYHPYRPLLDLSLRSDSTRCIASGDSVQVWFTLCNTGEKPLLDSVPISFYSANPTTTAAPLLRSISLRANMHKSQCRTFSVTLPNTYTQPLYAAANDDGQSPRPYSLAAGFPAHRGKECGYADNITSFQAYYPAKPFDLGPDIKHCVSSTLTLSPGSGYVSYRWQNGSTDSLFTAYTAGKYWVETTDFCEKTYSDTIQIRLDSIGPLNLPADTVLCTGDSTQLSVSGNQLEHISWSPATGLSCTTCYTPLSRPATSVTYFFTVAKGECYYTDSVRVQVQPFELQLQGQVPTCHTLGSVLPQVLGIGPFDFLWSTGSTAPTLQDLPPGHYALTLTNAAHCVLTDSIELLRIQPTAIGATADSVSCYGYADGRIRIGPVQGGLLPLEYSIDGQAFGPDSLFKQLPAGNYPVVVRDANGCTLALPGGLHLPQPAPFHVTLTGSTMVIPGLSFPLHAEVAPPAAALKQIRWEPAALFPQPDHLEQMLSIQSPTLVYVIVTDEADCATSDSLYIGLDLSRFVYFPNVFHPDGPSLVENTRFTAYGSDAVARIRRMRVFDRWGNLLFENTQFPPNQPDAGWDGRHNDRLVPPGVYVWTAEVEYTDGARQQFQGEVSIVR